MSGVSLQGHNIVVHENAMSGVSLQGHNIVVHENAMSGVSPWVYPHKIPLRCPWIATGRYRVVRITNEWLLTTAIILIEQGQRTHQYKRTNTGGRASLVWTFSVSVCWYKHFPCLFLVSSCLSHSLAHFYSTSRITKSPPSIFTLKSSPRHNPAQQLDLSQKQKRMLNLKYV